MSKSKDLRNSELECTIHVQVETLVNNRVVIYINGEPASWEMTHVNKIELPGKGGPKTDKLSAVRGAGDSEVRVAMDERFGGPSGTYSSVSVRIEISAKCGQSDVETRKTSEILYGECVRFLESHAPAAVDLLHSHLERISNRG